MKETDIHNLLIEVLTKKPSDLFNYEEDKNKLMEYSKEDLIEICLISLDVIISLNKKLGETTK